MSKRAHMGIFGPGLSGKSTCAECIVKVSYEQNGIRALVLDQAQTSSWGPGSVVYTEVEPFLKAVWASENCLVVIEEATSALADFSPQELVSLFTRVRHRGHKLIIIAHRATALLPILREQLSHLFLFRQADPAAKFWMECHAEPRLIESTRLNKYEFLEFRAFGAADGSHFVRKGKLKL